MAKRRRKTDGPTPDGDSEYENGYEDEYESDYEDQ